MALKTTKPNMDAFIEGAKAEVPKEAPQSETAPISNEEILRRDKTFLLRLPVKLWEVAKEKAAKQKVSLHDYILFAIKEKIDNN